MAVRRQRYAQASWLVSIQEAPAGYAAAGALRQGRYRWVYGEDEYHWPRTQSAKLRIEFSFQLQMLCGSGKSCERLHGGRRLSWPTDADFSLNRCARVKRAAN